MADVVSVTSCAVLMGPAPIFLAGCSLIRLNASHQTMHANFWSSSSLMLFSAMRFTLDFLDLTAPAAEQEGLATPEDLFSVFFITHVVFCDALRSRFPRLLNPIHSPLVLSYFDILHLRHLLRNINTAILSHYICLER